jgi:hypothetical protein
MHVDLPPPPAADLVVDICDDDVEFYREHGYLVCNEISPPEEIAWLDEVYDWFLAQPRTGFLDGVFDLVSPYGTLQTPKVGQLLMPEQKLPQLRETALWKNARRIARCLLGVLDEQVENWGHLIYKSPHCDSETPWHQDEAYWDASKDYQALGCWVPLQDVDESNGCLWFLPGSHRSDVMHHRHYGDDPAVHILEIAEAVDTSAAVPVPLPAGAASFHHSRLLHFAGPNSSGAIRKAWANEFQTAPVQRRTPHDRPWVQAGRDAMARRYNER